MADEDTPLYPMIGVIHARGRGTTLPRKNVYRIAGKPVIEHFLIEMKRAECLDQVCVWSEDDEIREITERVGCVALDRPRTMVHYGSGFHTPEEWDRQVSAQLRERFGPCPIKIHLNCNYVLFRAESLDAMFDKLLEDPVAQRIVPAYEVQPHLYMENPHTGGLFPVWEHPGLDRQAYPALFRKIGISISASHRPRTKLPPRELWHRVSAHEGLDFEREEDVDFAEYMLVKRQRDADAASGLPDDPEHAANG